MLQGPLIFVDIDTQADFMEPSGALAVPGASEIIDNLAELTKFARTAGIPVLATADAHSSDEPDPEPFPPHCLSGTPGQHRIPATHWPESLVLKLGDQPALKAELPAHLTIEKQRYDFFTHPQADSIVAHYARNSPTFVVYGVATDYCVKAAVEGLIARGCRVALVVDAIRAVDPDSEPALLSSFAHQGVLLTLTRSVLNPPNRPVISSRPPDSLPTHET